MTQPRYRVAGKRDPRGTAKTNYKAPCPGCGAAPRKGDRVVRIGGQGAPNKWWHEGCREGYLTQMRRFRM